MEEAPEEGRVIKGQQRSVKPGKEEWDNHMRVHIPYRKWCPHCVDGKRKAGIHGKIEDDLKELEEVPVISFDYMQQSTAEGKEKDIGVLPTLVSFERGVKWVSANVVPEKGVEGYAVQAAGREIDLAGLRRVVIKSDQEPALKDLLRVVKAERPEAIELQPEESPVGESKSNGEIERAIQTVQGQMRTLKLGLESRYQRKILEDHPIWPWVVMYAALLINLCVVGEDGRTPYERRKGRRFKRELPEIGECIRYLRPESV